MAIGIYIVSAVVFATAIFLIRNKIASYILSGGFIGIQWALTIYQYFHVNERQLEYFTADSIGLIFLSVLAIIGTLSLYYSFIYLEKRRESSRSAGIYLSAFVILLAALTCAYLANHVAISWIFVELTTLSSSILIYHRRSEKALEATWKYIFICSVSVALIFIGILFLGMAVQEAKTGELFYADLLRNASHLDPFWLKAAFLFIFTGYTVKAGLVPMYTAGIDAKDKAPSPAGAMFSSAVLNVGFLGIFRMYEIIFRTSVMQWAVMVMIASAAISIFVAAEYMMRIKNFKRMFAYSSVEHMGIAILGLAMSGVGCYAAVLHLILHSFAKSGLFYQYGSVYRTFKSDYISDAGNYFELNLPGSLALMLGFFIITAIPPSGMFVSEFLVFRSMFEKRYLWLLILIGVLMTFIIWSIGENIFRLLFNKTDAVRDKKPEKISAFESLPQFALFLAVIYLGLNPPEFVVNLINEAVRNLH